MFALTSIRQLLMHPGAYSLPPGSTDSQKENDQVEEDPSPSGLVDEQRWNEKHHGTDIAYNYYRIGTLLLFLFCVMLGVLL